MVKKDLMEDKPHIYPIKFDIHHQYIISIDGIKNVGCCFSQRKYWCFGVVLFQNTC